ncbi:DUF6035 family protein [Vibrio astriarenae]
MTEKVKIDRQLPLIRCKTNDGAEYTINCEKYLPALSIKEAQQLRESVKHDGKGLFCELCGDPVTLSSMPIKDVNSVGVGHTNYFKHKAGMGKRCEWRSGSEYTKAEIYKGIEEGEQHKEIKLMLAETLSKLDEWGIDIDRIDTRFLFTPDRRLKGKSDVNATFANIEYIFEIQLHSESYETILRRKELYALLEKPLIWICNKYEHSSMLVSQTTKDIAYTNNATYFTFEKKEAELSLLRGELVLNAVYWVPELVDGKLEPVMHKKHVTISELTYRNGEIFLFDYKSAFSELRIKEVERCKSEIINRLKSAQIYCYTDLICLVKGIWPTSDVTGDDERWLEETFLWAVNSRCWVLKNKLYSAAFHHPSSVNAVLRELRKFNSIVPEKMSAYMLRRLFSKSASESHDKFSEWLGYNEFPRELRAW